MTNAEKLSEAILRQFIGSGNWYRHGITRDVLFNEGAKYVADVGGAYWLLDGIAICQRYEKRVAAEAFQVWKLTMREDRTASLVCDDGNDNIVYVHCGQAGCLQLSRLSLADSPETTASQLSEP